MATLTADSQVQDGVEKGAAKSSFLQRMGLGRRTAKGPASDAPDVDTPSTSGGGPKARFSRPDCTLQDVGQRPANSEKADDILETLLAVYRKRTATYSNIQGVYDWLSGFLSSTWVDPVCGDGNCEAPFEFPYYGHFGCKADCGDFNQNYPVTAIVVDLLYDFTHPAGSVASTTLIPQASWNLCPQPTSQVAGPPIPHGSACYYSNDQTFSKVTGSDQIVIDDIPNGLWSIIVRGDIFNKVAGSVRLKPQVDLEVLSTKNALLAYGVAQAAYYEQQILNSTWSTYLHATSLQLVSTFYASASNSTKTLQSGLAAYALGTPSCASFDVNGTKAFASGFAHRRLMQVALPAGFTGTASAACTQGFMAISAASTSAVTLAAATVAALDTTVMASVLADVDLALKAVPEAAIVAYVSDATGLNASDPQSASLVTLVSAAVSAANARSAAKKALTALSQAVGSNPSALASAVNARLTDLAAAAKPTMVVPAFNDTLTSWTGGANSYLTCSLGSRGPQYVGTCVNLSPKTAPPELYNPDGTFSYNVPICNSICDCSQAAAGPVMPGQAPVAPQCAGPAPSLPPSTLTQPWPPTVGALPGDPPGTYPGGYVCTCPQCLITYSLKNQGSRRRLASAESGEDDAAAAMKELMQQHGPGNNECPLDFRRRLMQATSTNVLPSSLDQVAAALAELQKQDTNLAAAATAASAAQAAAAAQLSTYAADNTVLKAVQTGFAALSVSHAALSEQLNAALNISSVQLAQAQAATQSLSTLTALANNQSAALQAVENAVLAQLSTLEEAFQRNAITQERLQRLQLLALISRLSLRKQVLLSNLPCAIGASEVDFSMTYSVSIVAPDSVRSRLVGLSNRVVAGMLVYVTRHDVGPCQQRFGGLASKCPVDGGALDTSPFGVDAAFKFGSALYNTDINSDPTVYTASPYYNCTDPVVVPSQPPTAYPNASAVFCKELFNAEGSPWGFGHRDIPGLSGGVPVFFDINMAAADAAALMQYIIDGSLLDPSRTQSMTVALITYNGELDYFCLSRVQFAFEKGFIQVSHATNSLRLDLYSGSSSDNLRLAGEIILALLILASICAEGQDFVETSREGGTPMAYFASFWNYVDVASLALFAVTTIIWWTAYFAKTRNFAPAPRYDVYANINSPANRLLLKDGGAGLEKVAKMYEDITSIAGDYQLYAALHGINIVLSLLRMLKLMDFQPRLGVITRTVFEAASDLGHFFVIFLVHFFMLTMVAHLMFGYYVAWFADLSIAINTSFTSILGDFGWYPTLESPPGVQGLLGTAYFWIWETVMILVLLNFLLAIICEAFNTAKSAATDSTSVAEELRVMGLEVWRQLTDRSHVSDSAVLKQLLLWRGGDAEERGGGSGEESAKKEEMVALKVGKNTFMTAEELKAIVDGCIAEAAASAPELGAQGRALSRDSQRLAGIIFATCARETPKEEEEGGDELPDAAELEGNEQYQSINETLNRLLEAHSALLRGHKEVLENQRAVERVEARLAALHADLKRLRALQASGELARLKARARNGAAAASSPAVSAAAVASAERPPTLPPRVAHQGKGLVRLEDTAAGAALPRKDEGGASGSGSKSSTSSTRSSSESPPQSSNGAEGVVKAAAALPPRN